MVETTLPGGSRQYLRVFRHHVLDPLSDADARLTSERAEVEAEIAAFREFRGALSAIDPVPARTRSLQRPTVVERPTTDQVARIADAFESTVMSVPHYDEVYDEARADHLTAELGDPAAAVVGTSARTVTPAQHSALLAAVDQAVADRESFLGLLDEEAASLATATDDITEIIDSLDDVVIQEWYRAEFDAALEEIVRDRQAVVHGRICSTYVEAPSLCGYLYQGKPWTFPVLTAVTRLRDTVVLD